MTTAEDVARALLRTGEALSKRLDDAPTGVVPGYSATLGGTVLPNGKLRYVGASSARRFDTSGATPNIANTTTVEYTFNHEETITYETPTDATWFDGAAPPRIIVPFTGILQTVIRPFWVTDNTTGTRLLEIDHERDSVSPGFIWDSITFTWPSKKDTDYLSEYPPLVWQWDVIAGDAFRVYNEHNGGVGTLKVRLDAIFVQIG